MNDPTVFGRDCFKLNCATTLFNQRDSAWNTEVAPALEEWIGRSESDIAAAWGSPATTSDRGPVRLLVYRRTHSETYDAQVGQVGKQGYFEKRENQFHCDLTLEFQGDMLADYATSGDRCQILWGPR